MLETVATGWPFGGALSRICFPWTGPPDHLEQHRHLVADGHRLRLRRRQDLLQPAAEVGRRGLVVEVQDDLDVVGVVGPAQDPVGPHAVLLAESLVLVEGGLPAVVVMDRGADLD